MLRFAYSVVVTVVLTTFFGLIGLALWPLDWLLFGSRLKQGRLPPIGIWVKYNWCRTMMWFHKVECRLHGPGLEYVQQPSGCVYVSNHQSHIDILVLVSFLPRSASFIAKKELLYVPIFGWAARAAGIVFIDRKMGTKDRHLNMAQDRLSMGVPLIVFPEGTRSPDGQLQKFKRGAFVMAIDAGVPIVPIAILNSRDLLPKRSLRLKPGTVDIYVDVPVSTDGWTTEDRHRLSDEVRERIAKHLDQFAQNRENMNRAEAINGQ